MKPFEKLERDGKWPITVEEHEQGMAALIKIFNEWRDPTLLSACDIPTASGPFSFPVTSKIEFTVGPLVDTSASYQSVDSIITDPDGDKKPDAISPELLSKRLRDW